MTSLVQFSLWSTSISLNQGYHFLQCQSVRKTSISVEDEKIRIWKWADQTVNYWPQVFFVCKILEPKMQQQEVLHEIPAELKDFKERSFAIQSFSHGMIVGPSEGFPLARPHVMEINCCEVLKLANTFEHIKHAINNRKCELPFQNSETFFVSTSFN